MILLTVTGAYIWEARRPPRRTIAYALAHRIPADPDDLGLESDGWTVQRPDGTELPVWSVAGSASTRTIVLVHGWGQSRINLLTRIEAFRPFARRIVLYDLRGHGDATGRSRLTVDEEEDLLAVINGLAEADADAHAENPEPITLVGFSMGAAIAIAAAARMEPAPDRVLAYGLYPTFEQSFAGRVRRTGLPTTPFVPLAMFWFRLTGLRHRPLETTLEAAPCPVHLLHGRLDEIAPYAVAESWAAALPHVSLHGFDDARHLDMAHVDAERHTQVIQALFTMYK